MKTKIITLLMLLVAVPALAVTLPWTSTFDGNEWTDGTCDGGFTVPGWDCAGVNNLIDGHYGEVMSVANYSSGAGGRGYRAWYSSSTQGSNQISVSFNGTTEIWIRFYHNMDGIAQLDEPKTIYVGGDGATSNWFALKIKKNGQLYFNENGAGCGGGNPGDCLSTSGYVSNPTGWHLYEFHVKVGSSAELDAWVDGSAVTFANLPAGFNITYNSLSLMTGFTLAVNATGVQTGYVLYDDVAISNTGYIGPLSGTTYYQSMQGACSIH